MEKTEKKIIPLHANHSPRFQADLARERNIIGRKIKAARNKTGLTQREFAETLSAYGIKIQTPGVNKWEKGETIPNAYQLVALCHALKIDLQRKKLRHT